MHVESETTSRFIKGLIFAWVPLLVFLVPMIWSLLKGISTQKATGLGAVAGGLSEALMIWGLISLVASEVYAVTLLVSTFSSEQVLRGFVAVVSIVCGLLMMIALAVLFIWLSRLRT